MDAGTEYIASCDYTANVLLAVILGHCNRVIFLLFLPTLTPALNPVCFGGEF